MSGFTSAQVDAYLLASDLFRHYGMEPELMAELNAATRRAAEDVVSGFGLRSVMDAVEQAFCSLRAVGYHCEHDWLCCQSCGRDALPDDQADLCLWYRRQDIMSFFDTGELALAWVGDAKVIRDALEAEGLTVDHDGSPGMRITVSLLASGQGAEVRL